MKIFNFGSLNIDHVYRVDQFVRPGETIPCLEYQQFCGGKGLNQSIALARAGAMVLHYGKVGADGGRLVEVLSESGVDIQFVSTVDEPTGHAIIQVSSRGENSIIIEGGANRQMHSGDIETIFRSMGEGDWLLMQNEVNGAEELFAAANKASCKLALNPAPMTGNISQLPLHLVNLLIVNETEGRELTGKSDEEAILKILQDRCPDATIVLTLGARGAVCMDGNARVTHPGFTVDAVDTTAAGDTFVGYFLAALSQGRPTEAALEQSCRAASICVTRTGAANSIPRIEELELG